MICAVKLLFVSNRIGAAQEDKDVGVGRCLAGGGKRRQLRKAEAGNAETRWDDFVTGRSDR